MKIVATKAMRIGNRRVAEGEEIDLPDRFAQMFLNRGHAKEAGNDTKPKEKTYKTRRIQAEDSE